MTSTVHIRVAPAPGFTLVEVLVSLVILSIGLLGIGKLILSAVKANDSAYMRSQATELTYSILDDMRANRTTATGQGYDTPGSNVAAGPCVSSDAVPATACTPAVLAQYDVSQWEARIAAALPNGTGTIQTVTTNGQTTATIVVQWDDSIAQYAFGTTPTAPPPPAQPVKLETVL